LTKFRFEFQAIAEKKMQQIFKGYFCRTIQGGPKK